MNGKSKASLGEFVRFKPLLRANAAPLPAIFDEMATLLTGSSFNGTVRFQLLAPSYDESFTILIKNGQARVEREPQNAADFHIIVGLDTWLDIAQGKLAPIEAFTRGLLRVRGDITLGQRIMKRLAAGGGRLSFC